MTTWRSFGFEWMFYARSASKVIFRGREPTTGARCPTLLDKWVARDLLYAQSHRHGWTYQGLHLTSHGLLGRKSKCSDTRQIQTADLSVLHHLDMTLAVADALSPNKPNQTCQSTVQHTNHQTTMTAEVGGSIIPQVLIGKGGHREGGHLGRCSRATL